MFDVTGAMCTSYTVYGSDTIQPMETYKDLLDGPIE